MRADALQKRVDALTRRMEERGRPEPVFELPFVLLTDDGQDWPGCEESNARAYAFARARGIGVDVYAGIGPDDDGIEP